MITTNRDKIQRRVRRKRRVRKNVAGTEQRYRLSVYRSLNHFYAQIIDDVKMNTVVAASSADKDALVDVKSAKGKLEKSKVVGTLLAKRAVAKNVKDVVFDRNGYLYHGRIKAFADAAREGGLSF